MDSGRNSGRQIRDCKVSEFEWKYYPELPLLRPLPHRHGLPIRHLNYQTRNLIKNFLFQTFYKAHIFKFVLLFPKSGRFFTAFYQKINEKLRAQVSSSFFFVEEGREKTRRY